MIQLQLGHGVIKGCRDAVDWSPLEGELAINAGPFPLVELINLLLWQAYEIPCSGDVLVLAVIRYATAVSL